MTLAEFDAIIGDLCNRADRPHMTKFIRETVRELDSPPHPDTARADAAERMLAGVMATIGKNSLMELVAFGPIFHDVPGLAEWWKPRVEREQSARRLAALTTDLARLDAERERVARELSAITSTENASR